jgi:hypothetical protein
LIHTFTIQPIISLQNEWRGVCLWGNVEKSVGHEIGKLHSEIQNFSGSFIIKILKIPHIAHYLLVHFIPYSVNQYLS